eukprot:284816255_4
MHHIDKHVPTFASTRRIQGSKDIPSLFKIVLNERNLCKENVVKHSAPLALDALSIPRLQVQQQLDRPFSKVYSENTATNTATTSTHFRKELLQSSGGVWQRAQLRYTWNACASLRTPYFSQTIICSAAKSSPLVSGRAPTAAARYANSFSGTSTSLKMRLFRYQAYRHCNPHTLRLLRDQQLSAGAAPPLVLREASGSGMDLETWLVLGFQPVQRISPYSNRIDAAKLRRSPPLTPPDKQCQAWVLLDLSFPREVFSHGLAGGSKRQIMTDADAPKQARIECLE